MLQRITGLAVAAPRRVLAVTALLMPSPVCFAVPVTKSLSPGGFQDPARMPAERQAARGGVATDVQAIFMVTAPTGAGPNGAGLGRTSPVPHQRAGGHGRGIGLDGTTAGRGRSHQRRRQVGTGRRGDPNSSCWPTHSPIFTRDLPIPTRWRLPKKSFAKYKMHSTTRTPLDEEDSWASRLGS